MLNVCKCLVISNKVIFALDTCINSRNKVSIDFVFAQIEKVNSLLESQHQSQFHLSTWLSLIQFTKYNLNKHQISIKIINLWPEIMLYGFHMCICVKNKESVAQVPYKSSQFQISIHGLRREELDLELTGRKLSEPENDTGLILISEFLQLLQKLCQDIFVWLKKINLKQQQLGEY